MGPDLGLLTPAPCGCDLFTTRQIGAGRQDMGGGESVTLRVDLNQGIFACRTRSKEGHQLAE